MTIYEGLNPVSSPFCWRTNGAGTAWVRHNGIDVSRGHGAAQRFVFNKGAVEKIVQPGGDRGRYVLLRIHDFTDAVVQCIYQHLSSTPLRAGQVVTLGQIVGYEGGSGKTENSYASHCHFEVLVNGVAVYPAAYANIPNEKGSWPGNNLPPIYNVPCRELERQHPAAPTESPKGYGAYSRHPGYQNLGAAPYTKQEESEMGYLLELKDTRNNQIFEKPDANSTVLAQRDNKSGQLHLSAGLYQVIAAGVQGAEVPDTDGWAQMMYAEGKAGYAVYGGKVGHGARLLEPSQIAREYGCPLVTGGSDVALQAQLDAANEALSAEKVARAEAEQTADSVLKSNEQLATRLQDIAKIAKGG